MSPVWTPDRPFVRFSVWNALAADAPATTIVLRVCGFVDDVSERASWHVYLSPRAIKSLQVSCHDTAR